ncbi:DUF3291 domain-containing protein [Actibacterium sp. 188UL27-1]|uniref:DUF3291 domain-containing protein n=1 Tax=Actibacterium sp. 188UL27-1 TaxID=2786961 RepID=UPI00195E3776|nr:DUF3291 domain-containing protein [Actibacterium sp. 188UL27-1]MBM7067844.1 DUF3291 domain-containing protein [Actibacterium sp. 188UL27-1]
MTKMHLAEINIAHLTHDIDHPAVADFADNLGRINGLAQRMPGFVWRHVDDTGNATDTRIDADPRLIVNLSVWEDVAVLETFVWGTAHVQFYRRRAEWFRAMERMAFAMWWVPVGHRPTVVEATDRLAHLQIHGDTEHAFGWSHLAAATKWRDARCEPA